MEDVLSREELEAAYVRLAVPRCPFRHGPHNATATGPARPTRPTWMCAASARPVSLENRRRHAMVPLVPSFATVAVKLPVARRTLPLGLGTSCRDERFVAMLAIVAICPRIIEPYIAPSRRGHENHNWPRIAPGHYFLLGDNRAHSCDSRTWGTVPRDDLIGPVTLTYWPPKRLSFR